MSGGIHWTPEEDAYILEHRRQPTEVVAAGLAQNGRTFLAVEKRRSILTRGMRGQELVGADTIPPVVIPPSTHERGERLTIPHQDVALMMDLHINLHDSTFVHRVIEMAQKAGVKTIIFGGDLLDVNSFSSFGANPKELFDAEIEAVAALIKPLIAAGFTIYWFQGNHEQRFYKQNNFQLSAKHLRRLIHDHERLVMTPYKWMNMEAAQPTLDRPVRYPWHFTHPKNSSTIAARVPALMASRRWSGYHLAGGHGHLFGLVRAEDGLRWAWDVGISSVPENHDYAEYDDSTRPAMVQGAGLLIDDRPVLLYPECDWDGIARQVEKKKI